MHHDIHPLTTGWMDILIDTMEDFELDAIAAHSAIKNFEGFVSTALETDDEWNPKTFTTKELLAHADVITYPGILINTGLMACRLDRPWCKEIRFHNKHTIRDGKALFQPEDWTFSRDVKRLGGKIGATSRVKALHYGVIPFGTEAQL